MIILHARLVIKPEGHRARWLALTAAVIPPSRAEEACESYALYESVESPDTFLFVEGWTSLDGLSAHFHSPHFGEFMGGLGEVLAEAPSGTVSDALSTQTLEHAMAAAGIGG